MITITKNWISQKSISFGNYMKLKVNNYIIKPLNIVRRKIYSMMRWLARQIKYLTNLFIQKVATPLYISISHKIIAIWEIIKKIWKALKFSVAKFFGFIKSIFVNIYSALFEIVKGISKFYADGLEKSLRLALSFGNVGQLIFTIIVIFLMVLPSIICYFLYS